MDIKEALQKIIKGQDLTLEETKDVFEEIMTGLATEAQIGAFITALRLKGETAAEITGAAQIMRNKAIKLDVKTGIDIDAEDINLDDETIIDTCGTGGSGTNTFNVSTACAFIVAGCGLKVAKHGNRSVSSECGSADVLKELGVNIDLEPKKVAQCVKKIGIGFLYAPLFHGAMKYAIGPRREIGIRTIFNVLGPLTNPANANSQVLGVYNEDLTETIAEVLKNLGVRRAFVVCGANKLDEITITGPTKVSEVRDNKIKTYYIKPEDFNIKKCSLEDLRGGNAKENAKIIMDILNGQSGCKRDIVLLNAAAALVAGNLTKDFKQGLILAAEAIDSKKALNKLEELKKISNEL
jgi:anthranilate phosphoribosyltransferase